VLVPFLFRRLSGIASSAYNGRVDRANAIRLLKALIAAGANSNTLMVNAWVDDIAQREVSLRGTELAFRHLHTQRVKAGSLTVRDRVGRSLLVRVKELQDFA
jgi:hypothetical protein